MIPEKSIQGQKWESKTSHDSRKEHPRAKVGIKDQP